MTGVAPVGVTTSEWKVRLYVAPGKVRIYYVIADCREEAVRLAARKAGLARMPMASAVVSARWMF